MKYTYLKIKYSTWVHVLTLWWCFFMKSYVCVSKLHIRSGFCVYTRPSERCGTPVSPPCSGGRQPRPRGLSLTFLSHFSLSSLSSSYDPYPAWRALCFIWPAPQPPPCHRSSEIHFHKITSSACALGDSCIKLSMFLQLASVSVFQPSVEPGL